MQVAGLITSVKTIAERAKWARERLGLTQEQVAELAGVSQGTIGNLESGARKAPRELLAIAKALRVRAEWLKHGALPIEPEGQGELGTIPRHAQSVTTWKLAPLLPWERVVQMELQNDDAAIRELPPVPVDPSAGPRAKVVQMPDDSMEPRIRAGDLLLFDPDRPPTPKCIALVVTGDGQYLVRMYRVRSSAVWEAVAENQGYATLRSDTEGMRLVAVATGRWQSEF